MLRWLPSRRHATRIVTTATTTIVLPLTRLLIQPPRLEMDRRDDGLEERVLEAALLHVPTCGWSTTALAAGAFDCGLSLQAHGWFPRGGVELVEHFNRRCLEDLGRRLDAMGPSEARTTKDRVFHAVRTRLEMNVPFLNTWPQALALMAAPRNAPYALSNLGALVDDVWYHCGDRSTDFNWYTKRGLLAGVYTSTELFMLADASPDFVDTWAFLQRRLGDTATLTRIRGEVGSALQTLEGMLFRGSSPSSNADLRSTVEEREGEWEEERDWQQAL